MEEYIEDGRQLEHMISEETVPVLAKVWARSLSDSNLSMSVQLMHSQWAMSDPKMLTLKNTVDAVRETTAGKHKADLEPPMSNKLAETISFMEGANNIEFKKSYLATTPEQRKVEIQRLARAGVKAKTTSDTGESMLHVRELASFIQRLNTRRKSNFIVVPLGGFVVPLLHGMARLIFPKEGQHYSFLTWLSSFLIA